MQINNSHNTPSFCGATRIFRKDIFLGKKTFNAIRDTANSEFVGVLPREIIQSVIRVSNSDTEKQTIIREILEAFGKCSEISEQNSIIPPISIFERIKSFFGIKIKPDYKKKEQLTKSTTKQIGQTLERVFKKFKLIPKNEHFEVRSIGSGLFGQTFSIRFPESLHCTPKVFKHFFENSKKYNEKSLCTLHGELAENNIGVYISNLSHRVSEKAQFVDYHFGSLRRNFLVSEHAENYPERYINPCIKYFGKFSNEDMRNNNNIINGRIVDFGCTRLLGRPVNLMNYKEVINPEKRFLP